MQSVSECEENIAAAGEQDKMIGSPNGQLLGVSNARSEHGLEVHGTPVEAATEAGGSTKGLDATARVEIRAPPGQLPR